MLNPTVGKGKPKTCSRSTLLYDKHLLKKEEKKQRQTPFERWYRTQSQPQQISFKAVQT